MTATVEPPAPDPGADASDPAAPPRQAEPLVVGLDDPAALDATRAGGKAAALARARQAGLPTVPGVVVTTAFSRRHDAGADVTALVTGEVARAVAGLTDGAVAVRSSSVVEDGSESSAAGQFESVLDVEGPEALVAAVDAVLDSRARAGAPHEPIAVLIQPMVHPDRAGVAFGVDPVSGRSDRRVITAVRGSPAALVSGEVDGSRWIVDEGGHALHREDDDGVAVSADLRHRLLGLLGRVEELFGGPQDVEWAQVGERLLLLQSRPVTTIVRGVPSGPVFGPGPVAETFPEALAPLEEDLWVPPLRDAVREAIRISGTVSERALAERELVLAIDGRVAIDLEATGEETHPSGWRRWFGLGDKVRRLQSAWRIGRLRAALPLVADELAARVDADLEEVPDLERLTVRQLVALIDRGRDALRSLHAHEILLGLVSDPGTSRFTGGSVALRVLAEARHEGMSDAEIIQRAPVVLSLVPPSVGRPLALPSDATAANLAYDPPGAPDAQVRREALRLRVRWVHELVGQAAYEVGRRLVQRGVLDTAEQVRLLRLDEVTAVVVGQAGVEQDLLDARSVEHETSAVLPARFQLSDRGLAVAVEGCTAGTGTGAGGGTGEGPVTHDATDPPDGSVLVVEALSPTLGPILPRLAGLVSETGSVLSHLAILAREGGVPTVVGRHGAATELADGVVVRVDGQSGEVTPTEEVVA